MSASETWEEVEKLALEYAAFTTNPQTRCNPHYHAECKALLLDFVMPHLRRLLGTRTPAEEVLIGAALAARDHMAVQPAHPKTQPLFAAIEKVRAERQPKPRFVDLGTHILDEETCITYTRSNLYSLTDLLNDLHKKAQRP